MLGVAEWMISWEGKKWELKYFLLKSIKQCKAASQGKKKFCVFYPQMSNCSFSHTVKQYKKWSADHPRESEQYAIQSGTPYKQKELANTKKLQISGMFPGQITNSSNANVYAIFGSENNIAWPSLLLMLSFQSFKTLFKRQLLSYTSSRAYSYFEHMLS